MFVRRVQRQGNGLGVTIPDEEAERLGIRDGDWVAVSLNRVQAQVPDDVRDATEAALHEHKPDLDYLKDR